MGRSASPDDFMPGLESQLSLTGCVILGKLINLSAP